jgi:hypothetical protein
VCEYDNILFAGGMASSPTSPGFPTLPAGQASTVH